MTYNKNKLLHYKFNTVNKNKQEKKSVLRYTEFFIF